MQQKIVWVLVADAVNARIVERIDSLGGFLEIHNLTQSYASTHEHRPDQPGRGFENSSTTHHTSEHRTDGHEQQEVHFAKEIVTLLHEAHLNKKFWTTLEKSDGIQKRRRTNQKKK